MNKIVVLLPLGPEQKEKFLRLEGQNEVLILDEPFDPPAEAVRDADIIVGNINPEKLGVCRSLRFLQLSSAGTDGYLKEGVLPEGVTLACATGCYGPAISEHMLACLLAMQKKLYEYYDQQLARVWKRGGHVKSIYGARALIIGAGDIGTEFARKLKLLGAYTVGVRRTEGEKQDCFDEMYTNRELDSQLPLADIIALSLPRTPATVGILDRRRLELAKEGAYIINVGRGDAIDTDALCELAGRFGGVSLDVTSPEPLPPEHPLWGKKNVFITPHVSGGYSLPSTLDRIVDLASANVEAFLNGGTVKSLVDRSTGYRKKQ